LKHTKPSIKKPTMKSKLSTLILALLAIASAANAALVTGPWIKGASSAAAPAITNANTASPTVGDGTTTNNGAQVYLFTSLSTINLTNLGDKVTLTGSVSFIGSASNQNQVRWGFFDSNGNTGTDDTGWLGYYASHGNNANFAVLGERDTAAPNGAYTSSTGAVNTLNSTAPGTTFAASPNFGPYSFSLSLQKVATGLQINSSIIRDSDSQQYGLFNFIDTTPSVSAFNRVGLYSGSLSQEQTLFSNIDVTFVPEPSTALLGALGLLALLRRRR
jgi:hypothetical protein